MTKMLASVHDAQGSPYLVKGQGIFDEVVEQALRRFQRDSDLLADGIYGPQTARRLAVAVRTGVTAPKPRPAPKQTAPPVGLSDKGRTFISSFEGFRGHLYNDPAGHCTIGFGHLVHLGPVTGHEQVEFRRGITRQRALELLRADAAKAAAEVRGCVKVPLNQHQLDALVSFTLNVGGGNLRNSTLLRKLNGRDYGAVPSELDRWVKSGRRTLPGLVRRRKAEGALFARGVY